VRGPKVLELSVFELCQCLTLVEGGSQFSPMVHACSGG